MNIYTSSEQHNGSDHKISYNPISAPYVHYPLYSARAHKEPSVKYSGMKKAVLVRIGMRGMKQVRDDDIKMKM